MIDYDNMLIEERTVSLFLLMIFLKHTRYSYKLAIFSLVSVLFLVQFEYGNLKKKQNKILLHCIHFHYCFKEGDPVYRKVFYFSLRYWSTLNAEVNGKIMTGWIDAQYNDLCTNPFLLNVPFWSPWKHQKTKLFIIKSYDNLGIMYLLSYIMVDVFRTLQTSNNGVFCGNSYLL